MLRAVTCVSTECWQRCGCDRRNCRGWIWNGFTIMEIYTDINVTMAPTRAYLSKLEKSFYSSLVQCSPKNNRFVYLICILLSTLAPISHSSQYFQYKSYENVRSFLLQHKSCFFFRERIQYMKSSSIQKVPK